MSCKDQSRRSIKASTIIFEDIHPVDLRNSNNKGSSNKEENLKQEKAELNLKTVLEDLANTNLKVIKNWIPEITEPEPQFKNLKDDK
ncbi:44998_t:CDS:2, partial [Gigaspora margarita]